MIIKIGHLMTELSRSGEVDEVHFMVVIVAFNFIMIIIFTLDIIISIIIKIGYLMTGK